MKLRGIIESILIRDHCNYITILDKDIYPTQTMENSDIDSIIT